MELASVDVELRDQYDGKPMSRAEYQLIAARVRHKNAEVRRRLQELLALGTGPLPALEGEGR